MRQRSTCGAAGGACTGGQPSIQPTAITSAAATAPENGAISQGEIGRRRRRLDGLLARLRLRGAASRVGGFRLRLGRGGVSPDTLVASRSIVGGSRLALPASGAASVL